MAHLRKQIRDAAVILLTGLGQTAARVHPGRVYSVPELPALLVYTTEESAEVHAKGDPPTFLRQCELVIAGLAGTSDDDVQDTLDQIALEVEEAIAGDRTFSGLALSTYYSGMEMDLTGEGDKQFASIAIVFQVLYRTVQDDVETAV